MEQTWLFKIALSTCPGIGPVLAKNLVSYCGGVEAVWQSRRKDLLKIPGIGETHAASILNKEGFSIAEQQVQFLQQQGGTCLFYLDENYPWRLKQLPDAPIILYGKGRMDLNKSRQLGIVGTRTPSIHGKALLETCIEELKPYGVTVISGLAYGIDICAHRKCLVEDIPTIGVMGTSLDKIYPATHRKAAMDMEKNGGVLTEFPIYTGPDAHNFPMRNRIIAGLSDAILVVESAEQGGSMITADLGNQYHKDVFAFPGRPSDPFSKGCNLLIKTHRAQMVESAADIVQAMNWEDKKPAMVQQSLFQEFDEEEKSVLDLLDRENPTSIDKLHHALAYNPSKIASILLNLECKGAILALPGKRYIQS
jgi:DNA processing protein